MSWNASLRRRLRSCRWASIWPQHGLKHCCPFAGKSFRFRKRLILTCSLRWCSFCYQKIFYAIHRVHHCWSNLQWRNRCLKRWDLMPPAPLFPPICSCAICFTPSLPLVLDYLGSIDVVLAHFAASLAHDKSKVVATESVSCHQDCPHQDFSAL